MISPQEVTAYAGFAVYSKYNENAPVSESHDLILLANSELAERLVRFLNQAPHVFNYLSPNDDYDWDRKFEFRPALSLKKSDFQSDWNPLIKEILRMHPYSEEEGVIEDFDKE